LIVAQELGFFARQGLNVVLSREIGWATIRDKLVYGELEAVHALAPMLFAANAGLGCAPTPCETGLILNTHGNAITLSNHLWDRGVRGVEDLARVIRESRSVKTYTLGVVFPYSSHHFMLRRWLKSGGLDLDRDVRIVIVPPPQMVRNLVNGTLDGYCVGEPWNSLAVHADAGWCPAISRDIMPLHPEKILMVRREFAEKQPEIHQALITALLEACRFCQDPEHRDELIYLLSKPAYVCAPARALRNSLGETFQAGHGRKFSTRDFHIFYGEETSRPTFDKADQIMQEILQTHLVSQQDLLKRVVPQRLFRTDLFDHALDQLNPTSPPRTHEKKTRSNRDSTALSL
jgi:ABC-type nitrate/sulfonate/bicarbonate transport system substrate-binding protein